MCTVTFIPSHHQVFLTSNRDEKYWRAAAAYPKAYTLKTGNIIFPMDGDAGGTWFAVHQRGNALVFLNGAFIRHTPNPPYRKSRGLILLDLLDQDSSSGAFASIDLSNIEPFTAVNWEAGELFEYRWDGNQKHQHRLPADIPHIWSSATLYDEEVVIKRKNWFNEWLEEHPHPTQKEILHFHQFTGEGDQHNDLMINRDGKVFTVSVTSAAITGEKIVMQYVDVKQSLAEVREFPITNASIKA